MLLELSVENLLLIEQAHLRLAPGLNVITGETGAGKTVLAHALDLLLGGRPRSGIVRPSAEEAYVEGSFELSGSMRSDLSERLPAGAREAVLARRVSRDGRTRAYLNGRALAVGELRELAAGLLRFYGQHEHRRLTIAAAQLELLDGLCGPEQAMRLRACAEAHVHTRSLDARLAELRGLADARERELGLLEHELAEIDAAALEEDEHARLLAARERARGLDALQSALGTGAEALAPEASDAPGAVGLLASAASGMDALPGLDTRMDALAERLHALVIDSQDVARELRGYAEELAAESAAGAAGELDGARSLDAIEAQLEALERLLRKHGGGIRELSAYSESARARRDELLGAEVALASTAEALAGSRTQLQEHVAGLRRARRAAAPRLARAVHAQLGALGMGQASFGVALREREVGPSGADGVEFEIAPNPGMPAGPVREIASGGELSRIMLALTIASLRGGRARPHGQPRRKPGAAEAGERALLAFDELDAGIGGHTARAVGALLAELAQHRQLLCITHLPQIASLAARHFSIVKDTSVEPARASVVTLAEDQVLSELVRMLGADAGDSSARRHARELRRAA